MTLLGFASYLVTNKRKVDHLTFHGNYNFLKVSCIH